MQNSFQTHTFDSSVVATAEQLKSSGGYLYWIHIFNDDPAPRYLQLFDVASLCCVTVGTTTPDLSLFVVADGGYDTPWTVPMKFENGIIYAATTTATGACAPSTGLMVNFGSR